MIEKITSKKINLEIRKTFKLLIQYLSVAFCSIPVGILCYFLIELGMIQEVALIISGLLGLKLAILSWRFIDKRLFRFNAIQEIYDNGTIKPTEIIRLENNKKLSDPGKPVGLFDSPKGRTGSSIFKNQTFSSGLTPDDFINKGLPQRLEFIIAVTGLVILFPVLLIFAILVWLSSPGGIFFRQQRVGRFGKPFTIYKFRTMFVSNDGLLITAATDSRITRIGRILRQWKLDELPELYNVLRGEMSFVGPQPEVPEMVDFSDPAWGVILKARPGITDPVTLRLRNAEVILAKVENKEAFYREVIQPYKVNGYLEYLMRKSLKTDLKIIGQTIKVILFPSTAPAPSLEKSPVS